LTFDSAIALVGLIR